MRAYLGVAEIKLVSPDPDRLTVFYERMLGFVFDREDDRYSCLLGTTGLVIARGSAAPIRATLLVDDVEAEIARLAARGLAVASAMTADAWRCCDYYLWSSGFTDPDGNTFGLVSIARDVRTLDLSIELEERIVARFGSADEIRACLDRQGRLVHNIQWSFHAASAADQAPTLEAALLAIDALGSPLSARTRC